MPAHTKYFHVVLILKGVCEAGTKKINILIEFQQLDLLIVNNEKQ